SHKQLVDPKAYYLDRTAMFRSKGDLNAALGEATLAIKAIPDNGLLFAERAHIRFDMIHGKKDKTPEQAKDIRDDAKSAAEAMNAKQPAESAYIVGLLEEELGNTAEAEKHYREAMKLHPANDDIAGKYSVALGRLLLRERTEGAAPVAPVPPPAPDEEKKKKDDKKDDKMGLRLPAAERTIVLHPWSPMIVGAVLAQGQPFEELEDKETLARLNETLKLAEELIASKNDKIKGQGYLLKGSALSKFGKRTEGLKEYTKGLKMIFPGIETKEMEQLVADHPAFQRPDVSATPNPVMAERHFGEGMHFFWSKQYTEAEIQFSQATKYFDKDARYYYYLGLAQLHQRNKKKRDFAIDNFNEGARIEAKMATTNPDAVREVNASLERIQGELRQYLNSYRYNAKLTEPETKDAKDGK
ncbi:MAG: hypothetical protein HY289_13885, partial [Planctomycetes bacterium]|nr:hypothetical protein [Planctomycetota bacterium]